MMTVLIMMMMDFHTGIDQLVENGTGMLHLAILSHNPEAIQYLTAHKISPKLRDKSSKISLCGFFSVLVLLCYTEVMKIRFCG
jgi:hypothetical protein